MSMLSLLLLVQAVPAMAPAVAAKNDPNRMICVTEEVTGSRLGSRKRCLTATQWDEHRHDERMTVDRYQRLGRPSDGG